LENATQFSIQDTSGISSISWNFGDIVSGASNTAAGFNVNHTFSQIGNYNVQAILTNACGIDTLFFNDLQILKCNINPPPCIASFLVRDSCATNPSQLNIITNSNINSVTWNFGDAESGVSNTSFLFNPTHQFTSEGNFTITATVELSCGNYIATQNVQIFECDTARIGLNEIFVPEAFSPNSDGNNDKVFVRGSIKEFTFSVFNRWGELVFKTKNQTEGWDGSFRGKELDAGVFVYYLIGVDNAGNSINNKGNITLVK
jgi:gliding motility-associated-like protein